MTRALLANTLRQVAPSSVAELHDHFERGGSTADGVPTTARASAVPAPMFSFIDENEDDPKARLFRIGKTILVSFGVAEKRTGPLIGMWLKKRSDAIGVLAALEFARDQNVAEPVAYVSAIINGKRNGTSYKERSSEIAFRLAAELRTREGEAEIGGPLETIRGRRTGRAVTPKLAHRGE
jgi:hypothetical protein